MWAELGVTNKWLVGKLNKQWVGKGNSDARRLRTRLAHLKELLYMDDAALREMAKEDNSASLLLELSLSTVALRLSALAAVLPGSTDTVELVRPSPRRVSCVPLPTTHVEKRNDVEDVVAVASAGRADADC